MFINRRLVRKLYLVPALAGITVSMTVLLVIISGLRTDIKKLSKEIVDSRHANEYVNYAANNKDFLAKLSAHDALVWTLLAKQARENKAANGLQESWTTPAAIGTPVSVSFRGETGSYTAVIGTMIQGPGIGKCFSPCLAFYAGHRSGCVMRIENFDPNMILFRTNNEWINPRTQGFVPLVEDARVQVNKYLQLGADTK